MEPGHCNLPFASKKSFSTFFKISTKISSSLCSTDHQRCFSCYQRCPYCMLRKHFCANKSLIYVHMLLTPSGERNLFNTQHLSFLVTHNLCLQMHGQLPICTSGNTRAFQFHLLHRDFILLNRWHLSIKKRVASYYSTEWNQQSNTERLWNKEKELHHKRITGLTGAGWVGQLE